MKGRSIRKKAGKGHSLLNKEESETGRGGLKKKIGQTAMNRYSLRNELTIREERSVIKKEG